MAPSRGYALARPLFLCLLVDLCHAQALLTLPALERFNLTAGASTFFRIASGDIPSASRTASYFVTLNVCAPPDLTGPTLSQLISTPLLFASNSSSLTTPSRQAPGDAAQAAAAPQGFANLTFVEPATANEGMSIGVTAPDGAGTWEFELGASTTGPMHILDRHPLFAFDDSDQTTALLTGPTYVASIDGTPNRQALVVPISNANTPLQLASSSCFVRENAARLDEEAIDVSTTRRGVVQLTQREGATGEALRRTVAGGVRQQWALSGLTAATNYSVWGLEGTGQITTAGAQGMRLYVPQYFRTKSADNCRLIRDMAVCPQVAHSVPSPPTLPTSDLLSIYTSLITPHLDNFNVSLSTFPCDDRAQGMYSYVRTCADCLVAYTNWLCSIVLPRCDDVPAADLALAQVNTSSFLSADTNLSVFFAQPLDARPFPQIPLPILGSSIPPPSYIVRSDPATSRTPLWGPSSLANLTASNESLASLALTPPFPYAERMPCSSLCHLVMASCPASLGFTCPVSGVSLEASYGVLRKLQRSEQQGGDQAIDSRGWGRPGDRFGNVWCNAMGSDVLLVRRTGAVRKLRVGWVGVTVAAAAVVLLV